MGGLKNCEENILQLLEKVERTVLMNKVRKKFLLVWNSGLLWITSRLLSFKTFSSSSSDTGPCSPSGCCCWCCQTRDLSSTTASMRFPYSISCSGPGSAPWLCWEGTTQDTAPCSHSCSTRSSCQRWVTECFAEAPRSCRARERERERRLTLTSHP